MRRSLTIVNIAIVTLSVVVAGGAGLTAASGQAQVKLCKIQAKQLMVQKTARPLRLPGLVLPDGSVEYHLKSKSNLTVEIQLVTDSKLTFNLYLVYPPKAVAKQVKSWSGTVSHDEEYILAISNCPGKATAKYEVTLTAR